MNDEKVFINELFPKIKEILEKYEPEDGLRLIKNEVKSLCAKNPGFQFEEVYRTAQNYILLADINAKTRSKTNPFLEALKYGAYITLGVAGIYDSKSKIEALKLREKGLI